MRRMRKTENKMKIVLNRFKCDECGKESSLFEDKNKFHSGYPYSEDWVYLYAFSFKEAKDTQKCFNDKHFCSKLCLKNFITKKMEKEDIEEYFNKKND
jgi:hypothetical protein